MAGSLDLHIHSTFSDGLFTPAEILEKVKTLGISTIAITDHDTTSGIPELTDRKNGADISIIPGVELSAHHELASIHILGYGFDHNAPKLRDKLKEIQIAREQRNISIVEKLKELNFDISYEEVRQTTTGQIGRPHIANLLVKKGIVANEHEAFIRFLRKGSKAYVERALLPSEEAIQTIREAGGIAVIAHPATVDPTCIFLPQLIDDLKKSGLQGLEVYHPAHNPKHIRFFSDLCEKLQLLPTAGSDFHGRARDHCQLGNYNRKESIKPEIWPQIKKMLEKTSLIY